MTRDECSKSASHCQQIPDWLASDHPCSANIPALILKWLLDDSSLTTRLKSSCREAFSIRVLDQRYSIPDASELEVLALDLGSECFIRRVYLQCHGVPVVYARTVIPLATLTGEEQCLLKLGDTSLGGLLFAQSDMHREEMQIAKIVKGQALYREAAVKTSIESDELWGRRSIFYLHAKQLLVNEIFLPAIQQCKN